MEITRESASDSSEYKGQQFYFCSPGCKQQFDQNPEQYANDLTRQHS
jgi:YHS domain-containing protein